MTGDENCLLKVQAFDMSELSLPNTAAMAGTWQKFTATFSVTNARSDVSLLIDCREFSGTDIVYLDNWSLVEN